MSRRTLEVRTPAGGRYPIHIEPGLLGDVAAACRRHAPAHRYAVITDSRVARLYGSTVMASFAGAGLGAELVPFPAGEWNKSREQWAALSDRMVRAGFGRDSAVVALGGGVAGDLAGFVAATYMRGLPVVQVPTTLLAMLDSSVGGKTGVDTKAGKNLIGAFHHPSAVLIDPAVLRTLPRHQRCAGLAEAVKTAAILDLELWRWIESRAADLVGGEPAASAELIERVVRHKAAVVADDPLERGVREILNFGHTVGHALEALEGYKLLHGEAVAAGIAGGGPPRGVARDHGEGHRPAGHGGPRSVRARWRLGDGTPPHGDPEAMSRDKKARRARVRCVFLARVGEVATDPDGRHSFTLDDEALGEPLAAAYAGLGEWRLSQPWRP